MTTQTKTNCIVIGGGIIGMSTARALARRGLSVRLFERGGLGSEASFAAGGILSSMRPWSENARSAELSKQGQAIYADFAATLKQETGIDSEYEQCGLLLVNAQDIINTKNWTQKNHILLADHRLPESLSIRAATILLPQIAQIRVPYLLNALKASLSYYQIAQHEQTVVMPLELNNGRFERLQAGGQDYVADAVVVTAGAWSGQLLAQTHQAINIKPIHGQMLCVRLPNRDLKPIVLDGGHYLIPRQDGHLLIGSTMEHQGFLKSTTTAAKKILMDWACNLYPAIASAEFVRHWSGLRPATDEAMPYIRRLAGTDNVFINAGHFRKGILQAPVCAEQIADLVYQSLV